MALNKKSKVVKGKLRWGENALPSLSEKTQKLKEEVDRILEKNKKKNQS